MLKRREVVAKQGWVKGLDGRYRRHSVVKGIRKNLFDLTVVRREAAGVGFDGPAMRGIVPATGTFTEPVDGARPEGRALRIREKGGWKDESVDPDEILHISLNPL